MYTNVLSVYLVNKDLRSLRKLGNKIYLSKPSILWIDLTKITQQNCETYQCHHIIAVRSRNGIVPYKLRRFYTVIVFILLFM